jgi:hypothetical protein
MTDVTTPTGDAGTPILLGHKSFHRSGATMAGAPTDDDPTRQLTASPPR